MITSIGIYVIIRVYSGFSLVKNRDLLDDKRTLTPFPRQANHSHLKIINSQWDALFCKNYNHTSNDVLKSFYRISKLVLAQISHLFII